MVRINIIREKILNGDEKEIYYSSFTLNIEDSKIEIKGKDFYDNPLRSLKNKISEFSFEKITEDFLFKKNIVEIYLDREDELPVYYFMDSKYIVLLNFGEVNPNHFVVNLLGVWKYELNDQIKY